MKKRIFALFLVLCLLTGCTATQSPESTDHTHVDAEDNALCDTCGENLLVRIDLYSVNDLHGKVADGDEHPGVDELTTYIKTARESGENVLLLSAGDMWQGSSESNMTRGQLTTQWMNDIGFAAMTMGNHEYDWGEAPIEENAKVAQFPFLAINIYDRQTNEQVSYCKSSTVVTMDGIQIGIIGAIGDCYSSISADKVSDVYFKVGQQLTDLVAKEADRLRAEGADLIVYVLHDGFGQSKGASVTKVTGSQLSSYYDTDLSNGYVDIVFEGHSHQRYLLQDEYGVYHVQNGGDNQGISYAQVSVNSVTGSCQVQKPQLISTGTYARMEDDPIVSELLLEYDGQISPATRLLGTNSSRLSRNELRQIAADLYYEAGMEKWGQAYDIVLGGGFFSVRDPGYLAAGEVTYADLYGLFPFDNDLVLCSISGRDLRERFFETDNSNYFISYGRYGEQVRQSIDPNATYYVVVDTYSSLYGPNNLTEVERYDKGVYTRDLLAQYIEAGGLE